MIVYVTELVAREHGGMGEALLGTGLHHRVMARVRIEEASDLGAPANMGDLALLCEEMILC